MQLRYLATPVEGENRIIECLLSFGPRRLNRDLDFSLSAGQLIAGQLTIPSLGQEAALGHLRAAISGGVAVRNLKLNLAQVQEHSAYYSEMSVRDRWFADLHLQISGGGLSFPTPDELLREDYALRAGTPPFDGITELTQWLGLTDRRTTHIAPSITIRIGTPVDVMIDQCTLRDNRLHLSLLAHAKVSVQDISLAARGFPGNGYKTRLQLSETIQWKRASKGLRAGEVDIDLESSDSALVMLALGDQTVRRHWFVDSEKATNVRLVALQTCDKELKQLRRALFNNTDSLIFEQGIQAVLFLLGFSAGPQLEKDAPDIVLVSPAGTIALVECTTRISDLRAKAGKLVERRQLLTRALTASGHTSRVDCFLVTSQARSEIAAEEPFLSDQRVALLTRESLEEALNTARLPGKPDDLLQQAAQRLEARRNEFSLANLQQ